MVSASEACDSEATAPGEAIGLSGVRVAARCVEELQVTRVDDVVRAVRTGAYAQLAHARHVARTQAPQQPASQTAPGELE